MRPKSVHWADIAAAKIVNERGDSDSYTVASGITPSGTVHIGNFREVITVDLVARALKDLGKNVRFVYSWDDFDTFRKVPQNLPEQEMLKEHLKRPISRVPDPYGEHSSYAEGNIKRFEKDLQNVGIEPEFLYQHARYSSGMYAEHMRQALRGCETLKEILNQYRKQPLADDWLPTAIYCEKCDRDQMEHQSYDGDWGYSYKCASCSHQATTDIRTTKNLKLNWRTDWPMRWEFEKVDFEPGGKDHSSQGGSYDTAKQIVDQIWGRKPPNYLQYDFVSIKGMAGKMSSSTGILMTLAQALRIYTPQMVRWIFAGQRPNHDFALSFDQDVIKTYDEFDRGENKIFNAVEGDKKIILLRRSYELSTVDNQVPAVQPKRPGFRDLCSRLQICDGDLQRTFKRYYAADYLTDADQACFFERAQCAWNWVEEFAPEEFKYRLNQKPVDMPLDDLSKDALAKLISLISESDLESLSTSELNQKIYDDVIKASGINGKDFFSVVYHRLIGRPQGPRLPGFIKEVGQQRILELL
jgi:lysyl-tRNA synthetase, class I